MPGVIFWDAKYSPQGNNQEFLRVEVVSWNNYILINISSTTHERKALEKNIGLFTFDTLKTTFQMRNLTRRWVQSENAALKIRALFSNFKKGKGRLSTFPPTRFIPAPLYKTLKYIMKINTQRISSEHSCIYHFLSKPQQI